MIKYVAVFRNKGKEIGVSLAHPHSQIYALPFIPARIREEIRAHRSFRAKKGSCLICRLLDSGKLGKPIYSNDHFQVFLPNYAMWPYELHIYPRDHSTWLTQLSHSGVLHLADALRAVSATYNNLFQRDLPYIMAVHQGPTGKWYVDYHMHVEFYQPYRESDKLKYAAGIEWGFWTFTYDGNPKDKAEELREALLRASKTLNFEGEVEGSA
jgi:UDPglucose--hexose-1-phosphate uridylyltransferase